MSEKKAPCKRNQLRNKTTGECEERCPPDQVWNQKTLACAPRQRKARGAPASVSSTGSPSSPKKTRKRNLFRELPYHDAVITPNGSPKIRVKTQRVKRAACPPGQIRDKTTKECRDKKKRTAKNPSLVAKAPSSVDLR